MFYTIGYIFAGLLTVGVVALLVAAAADRVMEARMSKQYLPDIVAGGNIGITIDDGNQKYYRIEDVSTWNDDHKTKNQRYVKELVLHELTGDEITQALLK